MKRQQKQETRSTIGLTEKCKTLWRSILANEEEASDMDGSTLPSSNMRAVATKRSVASDNNIILKNINFKNAIVLFILLYDVNSMLLVH